MNKRGTEASVQILLQPLKLSILLHTAADKLPLHLKLNLNVVGRVLDLLIYRSRCISTVLFTSLYKKSNGGTFTKGKYLHHKLSFSFFSSEKQTYKRLISPVFTFAN